MNRRQFLKLLSIGAASVAAPKFIFDTGANLYKYDRERELQEAAQMIADRFAEYVIQAGSITLNYNPLIEASEFVLNVNWCFPSDKGLLGGIWRG